jgi:hypothetical protein
VCTSKTLVIYEQDILKQNALRPSLAAQALIRDWQSRMIRHLLTAACRATPRQTLVTLDLYHADIGPVGATALSAALLKNSSLSSLNLDGNNIGDAGAEQVPNSTQ